MRLIIETYGELAIGIVVTVGVIGLISQIFYSPDLLQEIIRHWTLAAC